MVAGLSLKTSLSATLRKKARPSPTQCLSPSLPLLERALSEEEAQAVLAPLARGMDPLISRRGPAPECAFYSLNG